MDPQETAPTPPAQPAQPAEKAKGFDTPTGRGPRFKNRTRSHLSTVGRKVSTAILTLLLLAALTFTAILAANQWPALFYKKTSQAGGIVQTQVVNVSHRALGGVFETRVRSTYRVDDQEHVTNNLSLPPMYWFTRRQANRIAAKFPQGESVHVYYNPSDPAQAVVERRLLLEHAPTMLLVPPLLLLLLGRIAGPFTSWLRSKNDPSHSGVSMDRIAAPAGGEQLRVRMPSEDAVRYGRRVGVIAVTITMLLCAIITWFLPGSLSLLTMVVLATACAGSGIAAGVRRAKRQLETGRYLLLDPQAKTLVAKGRGRDGRKADIQLHAHEIEAVVIEDTWRRAWRIDQKFARKANELMQDNSTVTVRLRTGAVLPLAIWHHPRSAPQFGKWLCGALAAIDRGEMPGEQREQEVDEEKD